MSPEQRLEGLVLRSSPLGESDRLLTLLSAGEGLTRLAAPGARKPKSSLAGAVPLAVLSLQVGGRSGLRRVRQLQVLRNFSALAERLETLAAAQGLAELTLQLVPSDAPVEGVLDDLLLHAQPGQRLQALLWDVDGTLAETERDGHRLAFNRAFADVGVPLHWDAARYGELLANVDSLHGGAESLLTISNLLVVLGFSGVGAAVTSRRPEP